MDKLSILKQKAPIKYLTALATAEILLFSHKDLTNENPDLDEIAGIGKEGVDQQKAQRLRELFEILNAGGYEGTTFPTSKEAQSVLELMQKEHDTLCEDDASNPVYFGIYVQVLPFLVELRAHAPSIKSMGEIHAIFATSFFYRITKNMDLVEDAVEKMQLLLDTLSEIIGRKSKENN